MSSVAGTLAAPYLGAYAASKHALEGLSDALRRELMIFGVDVIVIEPGVIRTPIWDKADRLDLSRYDNTAYGPGARRLQKWASERGQKGAPVELVAKAVVRALTARRPPDRIRVCAELSPRLDPAPPAADAVSGSADRETARAVAGKGRERGAMTCHSRERGSPRGGGGGGGGGAMTAPLLDKASRSAGAHSSASGQANPLRLAPAPSRLRPPPPPPLPPPPPRSPRRPLPPAAPAPSAPPFRRPRLHSQASPARRRADTNPMRVSIAQTPADGFISSGAYEAEKPHPAFGG